MRGVAGIERSARCGIAVGSTIHLLLVKFVKKNCLNGRSFIDHADLDAQCAEWQTTVNTERPSQATDVTPLARLAEEIAKGRTAAGHGR